ncbi:MAG: glycosyltransferase family 4 protein [Candidatus Electrothrix sp. GW3-4]|uniref:glycosyltransferase family 4 protein n=1 Tax=Candidatus Electrothrix sp. GW3-4 TaxID=3126740 RepID=UPI0030CB4E2B
MQQNTDQAGIRVNYGFDRVPGPDEHIFGGLVKLQDLNSEFPHCTSQPNILYLVSSALPYFPLRLAKMARQAGAKIVVNQNGVAYPGWFGKGWQRANRSMAYLHSIADYVFYQSEFCRLSAERFLGERSGLPSEVLYNPVDTDTFSPTPEKTPKRNNIILLLSGSHWSRYRVNTALETLQKVRLHNQQVSLKIAGRFCWGEDKERSLKEVKGYASQLGIAEYVQVTGPYTQEEAPALLNSCSILLHTKYNDPCPRLVVEAMACGLPVVYSATGGVPELVGESAGRGIAGQLDWEKDHPPNVDALADAVLQVASQLPEYSAAARQRAVSFLDRKQWLRRHGEVFAHLI